jgi:hypothetical protein
MKMLWNWLWDSYTTLWVYQQSRDYVYLSELYELYPNEAVFKNEFLGTLNMSAILYTDAVI